MPVNFNRAGAVICERLEFEAGKTENIGGVDYYYVYVSNLTDQGVADVASGYGVFSLADGGGTQYTVYLTGVPGDASEYVWDRVRGQIFSLSTDLRYAYYKGYGQLVSTPVCEINLPFTLTSGLNQVWDKITVYQNFWAYSYTFRVQKNLPTSEATITVHNSVDQSRDSFNITIPSVGTVPYSSPMISIPNGICFTDYLTIKGDGKGVNNLVLQLCPEI